MNWTHQVYTVTDERFAIDIQAVHALLATCPWASWRPLELNERAIANSLCLSAFHAGGAGELVGFVRVVSDRATVAWLSDLVVHPDHRRRGLGEFLMNCVLNHPEVPQVLQVGNGAKAFAFHKRFGFELVELTCRIRLPDKGT